MIIDSFDNKTNPIFTLKDFYGEPKHIIDICLIIFSKNIYKMVLENYECEKIGEIHACNGITEIYKFNFQGKEIGFYLTPVGATAAAEYCYECSWITGARKFIMFGSAGSLDNDKTKNRFVIPTESYRDEGMSYHYMEPSDYIAIKNHDIVRNIFEEIQIPYVEGRVWTTDAFLRETVGQIKLRKEEGCIAVEMEVAGVQAVCNFYGLELYNFLATGDVLTTEEYHVEGLHDANHNFDKFYIALEIAKRI